MRRLLASAFAMLSLASAIPVFADDASSSSSVSSSSSTTSVSAKAHFKAEMDAAKLKFKTEHQAEIDAKAQSHSVDGMCMQTAVDKRDAALITAVKTMGDSWVKALETRRTALKAAWAMTDEKARRDAVKGAWQKYRSDRKTIRQKFNSDRKAAWDQFKKDAKSCHAPGNGDEGGEGEDNA